VSCVAFRIGEVINKRYTVNASHGKGVFSTVLIAKDAQNNDVDVAIKVIRNNDTMYMRRTPVLIPLRTSSS
jgi:serine/threonine-protein kinase PRP4